MWYCKSLHNRIVFNHQYLAGCCQVDLVETPFQLSYCDDPEDTYKKYIEFRERLLSCPEPPKGCIRCPSLLIKSAKSTKIEHINLSFYPSFCQCRCIYCDVVDNSALNSLELARQTNFAEQTSIIISLLRKNGLLSDNAVIQVSPGEITLHPHKEIIYKTVENYKSIFYTNGLLFDERIAGIISRNDSIVQCDIDAGTRDSYKRIKGIDGFEKVLDNLKTYLKYSDRIRLVYLLIPDINDSDDDFSGIVQVMKTLGRHTLVIKRQYFEKNKEKQARSVALLLHYLHKTDLSTA